ncbi:hypothetical protein P5673_009700 [Acropora cervicornis]|uniref:Uncharacterized protein n=1 Tax=Acropora cervicornis TaxID=6130 RepID=A0AAD9QSC1_ACRCE|nr:hypothetical protein P5673_009700 [Acropora cervicornis]
MFLFVIMNLQFLTRLWKVLSDNGLSHKVLMSVLYSFIDSGDQEVELTISSIHCCFKKLWMLCYFGLVKFLLNPSTKDDYPKT